MNKIEEKLSLEQQIVILQDALEAAKYLLEFRDKLEEEVYKIQEQETLKIINAALYATIENYQEIKEIQTEEE